MAKFYETIEHTADLGIRVWGKDEKELFINAAKAFFDCITDLEAIRPRREFQVSVKGESLEECLFNWLDELLFLFDAKGILVADCVLKMERAIDQPKAYEIQAICKGERFDPERHPLKAAIKAVTYHNLEVTNKGNLYEAEVLFDI